MRAPLRQLRVVLEMIKFEHTLFALPFALMGLALAAGGWPGWRTLGWILVAMVGARSAAMGFNRLVDREIDAANPRTRGRALPAGLVTPRFVALFVAASSGLLLLAAWQLNPLCFALAPLALAVLLGYSYTKRFTALSHLVLGAALGGAPLGAWIAVRGSVAPAPFALAAAVVFWVAGFDVLYALQDREFDRATGLRSIPVRLGVHGALWLSGLFHLGTLALLALLPALYPPGLGWAYWLGFTGCVALLAYQHTIVRPGDLSRLDAAFFTANGVLSVWLFLATAVDLALAGRGG
ncbi:MAG TPA: UbiA-like polyprenyltransferase [Thermoanaerobaculia bacterium]|nr:MAG: 4-hydroxybenzoate octaprenyltransferase [Acidobacteria bacterium ADurb.Bin051]HNU81981.1 UbiA-like polyprenyltransferase [Thermoanaerobaculia bacterium]HQN37963.1 UbiA-like polyprenyltransferase [Thermoanaerobaculia bacterium]